MRTLALVLALLPGPVLAGAPPLVPPVLTPEQARAGFERWLREHDLDPGHYRLMSLGYDHVSGEWSAFWLGRGDAFDDQIHLLRDRRGHIEVIP